MPLAFAQVVLIGSTTGLLILGLYLGIRLIAEALRNPKVAVIGAVCIALLLPSLQENPKTRLIIELYQADGIYGLKTGFAAVSGGRFLASLNAMESIAAKPLGHGPDPDFLEGEKVEVDDFSIQGYSTRASARPVSSTLTFAYVYGIPFLVFLLFAATAASGRFRFTSHIAFALAVSVAYSPPFGEATLLLLLSALWAANTQPGTAPAQLGVIRREGKEA